MLVVFNDRDGDEVLKGGAGIWLLYYRRPVMTRTLGAVLWGRADCVNIPVFLHFVFGISEFQDVYIYAFLYFCVSVFLISAFLHFCIFDMLLGSVLWEKVACVNVPVFLNFSKKFHIF